MNSAAAIEPILIRAKDAAALCGVSPRTWQSLRAEGRVPRAYKLNGCVLWRLSDLRKWVDLGMPNLDKFSQLMEAKK